MEINKVNVNAADRLDKVDLQILRLLQENARLTTKELAAKVSLSSTPVFERLKRLESNGYIKKYIAVLDAEKLNRGFVVFCNVKMRHMSRDIAADFARRIQDIPEVTECYNISGSYDYLLKVHAPDMKYYQEFILNILGEARIWHHRMTSQSAAVDSCHGLLVLVL